VSKPDKQLRARLVAWERLLVETMRRRVFLASLPPYTHAAMLNIVRPSRERAIPPGGDARSCGPIRGG